MMQLFDSNQDRRNWDLLYVKETERIMDEHQTGTWQLLTSWNSLLNILFKDLATLRIINEASLGIIYFLIGLKAAPEVSVLVAITIVSQVVNLLSLFHNFICNFPFGLYYITHLIISSFGVLWRGQTPICHCLSCL